VSFQLANGADGWDKTIVSGLIKLRDIDPKTISALVEHTVDVTSNMWVVFVH
jgi:hypothetical protein